MRMRVACLVAALAMTGCGQDPLSETQRAFLSARGAPIVFTIALANQEVDASGMIVEAPPRRIDVWMYGGAPAQRVVFDNGFYVDSASLGGGVTATPLRVSPGDFTHGTSREEVERTLGPPDRVETEMLGTRSLVVLRWDSPDVVAVSFVDGELSSVVAGLQVRP